MACEKKVRNKGCETVTQQHGVVLVSNPSGSFFGGRVADIDHVNRRVVLDPFNRVQSAPKGFPDTSGWKSFVITQEFIDRLVKRMGQRIALFVAIEWKESEGGKLSQEQIAWLQRMQYDGCLAGVASSVEGAVAIVNQLD
jgi:hypothetical protein